MTTQLQALIDELADRLSRTVTVDDRYWNLEAYSTAHEEPDPLRLDALLHKRAPVTARTWADELRLDEARAPVRTPANALIGADPRVVFPIHYGDAHLGFLTLIDRAGDLDDKDVAAIERTAARAAEVLYRDQQSQVGRRHHERELLRELLTDDPRRRRHAVSALREGDLLASFHLTATVVALPIYDARGSDDGADRRRSFERGLESVRGRAIPGTTIGVVDGERLVVLVAGNDTGQLRRIAHELLLGIRDGGGRRTATVGLSSPVEDLADLPATVGQAADAAEVAARVPRFGGLAAWDEIGVYRTLVRFAGDAEVPPHPGFERLRANDRGGTFVRTLETYLDLAGDVRKTAAALSLHRSGLYYRLARIAELAEADLTDGEARLGLHLAIKLERMSTARRL